MYKLVSAEDLYKSFRTYEAEIEKEVKAGRMNNQMARKLLSQAKKNYKTQNLNRYLDRINET